MKIISCKAGFVSIRATTQYPGRVNPTNIDLNSPLQSQKGTFFWGGLTE